MTMTLNISDDLNTEEAGELVEIAKEQGRPLGSVLLESARRELARRRAERGTKSYAEIAEGSAQPA